VNAAAFLDRFASAWPAVALDRETLPFHLGALVESRLISHVFGVMPEACGLFPIVAACFALLRSGSLVQTHGELTSRDGDQTDQRFEKRRGAVLIVDDDENSRWAARTLLEANGFETFEAINGKAALELMFSIEEPALVILDLQMPIMTGSELLEIMRSYERLERVPVLICSAAPPEEPIDEERVVEYLRKPYESAELVAMVRARVATPTPT
jgi:CheY-like chemotaxis protein